MLNLLLTPLLMVIGLILSLLVMKVVGTLFASLFFIAMADNQADTWTGILSIIAYIIIFCSISVMLVTNACDLIHFIPDSALTWIGGQNGNALGKKISDGFAADTAGVAAMMNSSGIMGKGGDSGNTRIQKLKANAADRKNKPPKADSGGGNATGGTNGSGV